MTYSRKRWWVWVVEVALLLVLATDFTCLIYGTYEVNYPSQVEKKEELTDVQAKLDHYKFHKESQKSVTLDNAVFGKKLTENEVDDVKSSLKICAIILVSPVVIWLFSFLAPIISFTLMQVWVMYAAFWGDDHVDKAIVILQYIQVHLPLSSFKSLPPEALEWSEGLLFWWWEVKVVLIYAASTCSIYSYYRRSLDSSTAQDVESGLTHDDTQVNALPQDMECAPAQDDDTTSPFNTRTLLNLLLRYRQLAAHLLVRIFRSQAPNNLPLQTSMLTDQLEHQPSTLPDQLEHQPSTLPDQLEHQPSTLPDQLEHQPSTLPDQLEHQPSTLPDQLDHQPCTLPHQMEHQPSTLPDQMEHQPSTLLDQLQYENSSEQHQLVPQTSTAVNQQKQQFSLPLLWKVVQQVRQMTHYILCKVVKAITSCVFAGASPASQGHQMV
ncbi:hypothetical protein OTU49_005973 [Cherax quadricarinatus]|uniref:Uncharacterized protein n=1 Tax=Cherax quadricarinatus TaxID=27406 RepID=A0AAW0WRA3_CHEQU